MTLKLRTILMLLLITAFILQTFAFITDNILLYIATIAVFWIFANICIFKVFSKL